MQVCKLLARAAALGAKGFANEAATPSTVFIEDLAVCWRDVLGLFHRNLCAKSVARRGAQTCPKKNPNAFVTHLLRLQHLDWDQQRPPLGWCSSDLPVLG